MTDNTAKIVPQPPAAFAALAQKATDAQEDAVVVTLPDGRNVLLERPKGSVVARTLIVAAELVSDMTPGTGQAIALSAIRAYVESMMYVKAIDGSRIIPINSAEAYNAVANKLGDEGMEAVQEEIYKHWPPASLRDKETLKKNLPRSDVS